MSFQQIIGKSHIIPGPVATGAILDAGRAILIDTGLDDDSGKKIMKACAEKGVLPIAIVNTHSHADHCGGNAIIQKKMLATGRGSAPVPVFAPPVESALVGSPILESSYLYGAAPYGGLRQKFIMAKPSLCVNQLPMDAAAGFESACEIEGVELKLTYLPGHSINMAAVTTSDGVCFVGDGLFGKALLDKHPLLFIYDYEETLNSMKRIATIGADYFVLAHGGVVERNDALDLIESNVSVLTATHQELLDLLAEPQTEIGLHQLFVQKKGINESIPQYYLNLSVIKAHLTAMIDGGDVEAWIEHGQLLYRRQ